MNLNSAFEFQFIYILDNAVLAWGLAACGLAQFSKLLFELIFKQRWRPSVLIETGGMPSSHSALVTGTAAGIGSGGRRRAGALDLRSDKLGTGEGARRWIGPPVVLRYAPDYIEGRSSPDETSGTPIQCNVQ